LVGERDTREVFEQQGDGDDYVPIVHPFAGLEWSAKISHHPRYQLVSLRVPRISGYRLIHDRYCPLP
jgi:hypothetical protein